MSPKRKANELGDGVGKANGKSAARLCGLIANTVALVAIVIYVLSQAYPSTEAVRLRNALILDVGSEADFKWAPTNVPEDFLLERRPALPQFLADAKRVAGDVNAGGDWAKAVALAAMLTKNATTPGPLQSDLVRTYRGILEGGGGYCADYVDVYLALAHAAGMSARTWAFSFDGFGGHGHTFVEVFDATRGKWLLLDVFANFHAIDAHSGEPLSAMEFRDFVLGRREAVEIRPNGPSSLTWLHKDKLIEYYQRGANQWYLWWGNNKFSYDAHPLVTAADKLSYSFGQLTAIGVGVHPRIKVLVVPENWAYVQRMVALRKTLLLCLGALAILTITLLCQIIFNIIPRSVGRI